LDACRHIWERAGRSVVGCALSGRAAAELQAGTIRSTTIDRLLIDLVDYRGNFVRVDEAEADAARERRRQRNYHTEWPTDRDAGTHTVSWQSPHVGHQHAVNRGPSIGS
jgi:DUF917 family protein